MERVIRVAQWGTGGVGQSALKAILTSKHLELVGCRVYDDAKVGVDVGSLIGWPDTGVTSTNDSQKILDLKPDVVSYNALWANVDDFCMILEAGISIVTTSSFVTGHNLGTESRDRIEAAAQAGRAAIFGSGIHPGFSSYISLVAAGLSRDIEVIRFTESVDCSGYASAETWRSCGFGLPLDTPNLKSLAESGMRVFSDGIYLAGQALGLEFDTVRFDADFSVTEQPLDLGFMKIDAGCVAGLIGHWRGIIGGRSVVELNQGWKMGPSVTPEIELSGGYVVEVVGNPNISFTLKHSPPSDFKGSTPVELMEMNLITTAMPAINAIPHLLKAEPGIRTYVDFPLITSRGFLLD
ncbi:dihydrodipicolinate reductase [Parahaliea sp. F7430]|uniref:Dihydrodipicolinate reductase n=1 Tax=Sediminihaliea albiluteola TaxID=2758564 RepID=A0A7W2TWQ3_9GAMM|nr:dihydrodipicolinate reductase [Sediminihaliea albiluteola]MBA6413234.1 dihydrodipicolinate reductase [Sediminihaliea albiluteola]